MGKFLNKDTEIRDLIDKYKSISPPTCKNKKSVSSSSKKNTLLSEKANAEKSYERLKSLWMETRSKDHLNSLALTMEKLNDIDRDLLCNKWL